MKDDMWLYQHKWTDKKSHSVKLKDLEDLRKNAIDEHLAPCYVIDYSGKQWYLIDKLQFDVIMSVLKL